MAVIRALHCMHMLDLNKQAGQPLLSRDTVYIYFLYREPSFSNSSCMQVERKCEVPLQRELFKIKGFLGVY